MRWRSVETRLLFFYSVLLLVLGGIFSALTVRSFDYFENETIRRSVTARAEEIWSLGSSLVNDAPQLAQLLDRRFDPSAQNRFIRVSVGRSIVYQSAAPANRAFDPDSIPLAPHASDELMQYGSLYVLAKSFRTADSRSVLIESGQSGRFAEAIRSSLISSLLVGLPMLLMCAGVGGYFLIRQAWAPLGAMIRAAEAITFNDPHHRLPLTGTGDRIDVLGQSLNRMLDRLDNAYQHASRFSADAAHELRTPLSIIRGELEFIAKSRGLPPDVQGSVASALDEAKRLGEMTEHLLTLARMESVWGKREHAKIDLYALASETIEQMVLLADEKQIRLEKPGGASPFVFGDRGRLKQVLVNLLDNAIKYTPAQGAVSVELAAGEGRARLAVKDTGMGIASDRLDDIFRRFYRISPERGASGAGLGLAIARSICQAHGGTLSVRSTVGAGSEFIVELPAAGA